MKIQRERGEPLQDWLIRKYGTQIKELTNRVKNLEKIK